MKPAPTAPVPDQLTRRHRDAYAEHGYLAFAGLLTPPEIDAALRALDRLAASPARPALLQHEPAAVAVRKLMGFCELEPDLDAIAQHPRLRRLVEGLLGTGARLFQDMALLKPPYHGSAKPWHQDAAYFDVLPVDQVVGCWIALDPATPANGCMQVWPGAHRRGPKEHFHAPVAVPDGRGGTRDGHSDCQMAPPAPHAAQPVPLAPGGVLLFSPLLPHATAPNPTPDSRRALQLHYRARTSRPVGRAAYARAFVTAAGRPAACVLVDGTDGG